MNPGDVLLPAAIDPARVRPGWIALLIVVAMVVATVLLWNNMRKQLGRVDQNLPRRRRSSGSPDPVVPYADVPVEGRRDADGDATTTGDTTPEGDDAATTGDTTPDGDDATSEGSRSSSGSGGSSD